MFYYVGGVKEVLIKLRGPYDQDNICKGYAIFKNEKTNHKSESVKENNVIMLGKRSVTSMS